MSTKNTTPFLQSIKVRGSFGFWFYNAHFTISYGHKPSQVSRATVSWKLRHCAAITTLSAGALNQLTRGG